MSRRSLLAVLVAGSTAALFLIVPFSAAQTPTPPRVSHYFHRGEKISAVAPTGGQDASLGFGPFAPHTINFTSEPLPSRLKTAPGAYVVGTFAARITVRAVLSAVYQSHEGIRASEADVSISTLGTTVVFPFVDLETDLAAGDHFVIQIILRGLFDPILGQAFEPTTINVTMLYDSTGHPGGIRFGTLNADAPTPPPHPVPPGPSRDEVGLLGLLGAGTLITVSIAAILINRRK